MEPSNRLHSLDNLRAIMMWLGIVLHVAINHTVVSTVVFWRDSSTSAAADFTVFFIHAFRMPVFFILAGYFVARLVQSRGYEGMLRHRFRRIALPFVIFWPVLFAATALLIMLYLHVMAHGTIGVDHALIPKPSPDRAIISTLHLWFIYYLLWFCVLTAGMGYIGKFIPARWKAINEQSWKLLGSRWWGIVLLTLPLTVVGSFYAGGLVAPNGSFVPHAGELIHNGLFFVFGWYLYRHQDSLLALYSQHCWKYAAGGLLLFVLSLALFNIWEAKPKSIPHIQAAIAFVYNGTSWLWSFALIGIFVRYLPKQNAVLQYVSDSSYWVYMVHMLGTIGFGILIYKFPIGPLGKMGVNVLLTTAACLVTYQLLVRNTKLGILLNGRRGPAEPKALSSALA